MILKTSLKHGRYGYYSYRIHKIKLETLCNGYTSLSEYLKKMLKDCPDEYFQEGPRSSVLKFKVDADIKHLNHEIEIFARLGLDLRYYDTAHMNVQMFMLSYDSKTIAIEVPLWILPEEYEKFNELFDSKLPLTGHIDVLRIEDGKIWIWDYKPNAHREKYAMTQVYFYALMLSKRTGIPLEDFRCGYFDDKDTYIFNPSKINL